MSQCLSLHLLGRGPLVGGGWASRRQMGERPPLDRKMRGPEPSTWEDMKWKVVRGGTVKVRLESWVLTLVPPVRRKERITRWRESQRGRRIPIWISRKRLLHLSFSTPWIWRHASHRHTHTLKAKRGRNKRKCYPISPGLFCTPALSLPGRILALRNAGVRNLRLTYVWGRGTPRWKQPLRRWPVHPGRACAPGLRGARTCTAGGGSQVPSHCNHCQVFHVTENIQILRLAVS